VIPSYFPGGGAPLAYLDEPLNPMLIEFIDYLEEGNKIMFNFLSEWK
jgi:hypothetical protein